jgi:hypothetical protein
MLAPLVELISHCLVVLLSCLFPIQVGTRPPSFVVSLRGSERRPVDEASQRFLSNLLRSALGLHGLPVRLHLRWVGWLEGSNVQLNGGEGGLHLEGLLVEE